MKRFLAAVRFLTILPVPGRFGSAEADLARSVPFFPIVGLLIGGLAAALALGLSEALPQLPAAVLVVVALAVSSGGLHLDGLSDTADGFFSSREPQRILEIMRDSHAGPMGVVAIVCVLLLKAAALASVPPADLWRAAFLMPVAGRCAVVVMMAVLPYVRPEGGLGSVFYRSRTPAVWLWALLVLCAAGYLVGGPPGLAAGAISLAAALLFAEYARRKIGGATGDTLGAVCEIAEVVPALTMAAWPVWMRG